MKSERKAKRTFSPKGHLTLTLTQPLLSFFAVGHFVISLSGFITVSKCLLNDIVPLRGGKQKKNWIKKIIRQLEAVIDDDDLTGEQMDRGVKFLSQCDAELHVGNQQFFVCFFKSNPCIQLAMKEPFSFFVLQQHCHSESNLDTQLLGFYIYI